MMNSNLSLIRRLRPIPTSLAIFVFVVALIGFIDSVYLAVEHFQGNIPPCSITEGCDEVLTSAYSVMFGVPVSLLGSIYYFLILAGIFAYMESKNIPVLVLTLALTAFGFAFSLWFVYLQIFVIGSYCAYCLVSALTSTTLFALAVRIFYKYKQEDAPAQQIA